jgi:membrane protein DedA with SNARE-associated domain
LYAGVFVLAALENVFPHPPADVGVALVAFLAGRGALSVWSVFGLAWTGNVSSAIGVYFLARRYGRAFFQGRWGRKVLSEAAFAQLETAYRRHGTYGIFLMRLLPVWRGVVPPTAAIAGLAPARTLIPLALASAVWYGALVFLVATFGTNFHTVRHVLAHVNGVLVLLALVALVVFGIVVVRHVRRRVRNP